MWRFDAFTVIYCNNLNELVGLKKLRCVVVIFTVGMNIILSGTCNFYVDVSLTNSPTRGHS